MTLLRKVVFHVKKNLKDICDLELTFPRFTQFPRIDMHKIYCLLRAPLKKVRIRRQNILQVCNPSFASEKGKGYTRLSD